MAWEFVEHNFCLFQLQIKICTDGDAHMIPMYNESYCRVDPGYVKRGAEIQKGGGLGGWYNPKIVQNNLK